ncbi:MAG TPA: Uma2 family endonuclease [Gemmatimonadales bacterium]
MTSPIYYTAEMVRAMPEDGKRYEVIRGELLVTPVPRQGHQQLVHRLGMALQDYLERERVGHLVMAPADVSWGSRDTLVQPDLFVVPLEDSHAGNGEEFQTLLLVVEVLSSATARADRFTKRREYQSRGVPAYWIVDGEERRVEIWTPEAELPAVVFTEVSWQPEGGRKPFALSLTELFRPL